MSATDAAARRRSSVRYVSLRPDQAPLMLQIRDLAATRTRYGFFCIYILLRKEGPFVNHRRVYRLYRDDGLGLRLEKPRRNVSAANRNWQPAAPAANEMWSMDFVSDALFDGRRLRTRTVVDAFTRELTYRLAESPKVPATRSIVEMAVEVG